MHTSKNPGIKLGRAIAAPSVFEPSETWVEGGAIFRLDIKRGICKRSPLTSSSHISTMFYEVQPVDEAKATTTSPRPKAVAAPPRRPVPSQAHKPAQLSKAANKATRISRYHPNLRGRLPRVALAITAVVGLMFAGYPFLPAMQYQVFKSTSSASPQAIKKVASERPIEGNRVMIPKIGVDTPIVEGSSLDVLNIEEGVWHQAGGQDTGNFVLAGHRFKYLPPNTSTLYNLDKLVPGDTVAVDWEGRRTVYKVTKLTTVSANDTSILNPVFGQRLTIYTCTDKRQTQRTVAIAEVAQNP